jgi:hypothetical protein
MRLGLVVLALLWTASECVSLLCMPLCLQKLGIDMCCGICTGWWAQMLAQAEPGPPTRYLMYSINRGEGFNAVRDMVIRISRLTQLLSEHGSWKLVRPKLRRVLSWD